MIFNLASLAGCGSQRSTVETLAADGAVDGRLADDARQEPDTRQRIDTMVPEPVPRPTGTCWPTYACSDRAYCVSQGFKDCVDGRCIMCRDDADCGELYAGGCDRATGMCRLCGSDADCVIDGQTIGTGKCDPVVFNCTRCDSDRDCDGNWPTTVRCGEVEVLFGRTRMCVGCASDNDCATTQYKGCDPATGTCIACRSDSECCILGDDCGLRCDLASGGCLCADDEQCSAAYGGSPLWRCQP